jgi:hypothetical protein
MSDVRAEDQATLDKIVYKKRHTLECQAKNLLRPWQQLSDSRKRCTCPYWSCGVHDRGEGFTRRSTGEISLERAKGVVRLRVQTGSRMATLPDQGTPVNDAITDFMDFTRDGGARASSLAKYQTLMDQFQAFADWKGFRYIHEMNQDAVIEFRKAWEDANAGYKQSVARKDDRPLCVNAG